MLKRIKVILDKLFKKEVKRITVLDKYNELLQIAMGYDHPNSITKFISISYEGWINSITVRFWNEGQIIIDMSADFDSLTAIEDLEKIRVKLLKLIKTWEED